MLKRKVDLIVGLVFLLLSVIVFIGSFSIQSYATGSVGPEFFPRVIAFLLFTVSFLFVLNCAKSDNEECYSLNLNRKFLFSFFGLFFYALIIQYTGFIIMTTLYLFVHFTVLSGKSDRKFLIHHGALSLGLSVALYLLFVIGFDLLLPKGILG